MRTVVSTVIVNESVEFGPIVPDVLSKANQNIFEELTLQLTEDELLFTSVTIRDLCPFLSTVNPS